MSIKLLSDFDGVMANPEPEAQLQREIYRDSLIKAGLSPSAHDRLREAANQEISLRPECFGWSTSDRISAFADEDPFVWEIAISTVLDRWAKEGHQDCPALRFTYGRFLLDAHAAMVSISAAAITSHVEDDVVEHLQELLGQGVEIVIVSNSTTARVQHMLKVAGIEADGVKLRLCGGARKWSLGPTHFSRDFNQREVFLDRPYYQEVLLKEQPDLVIGDVFSLDLSLPISLRAERTAGFEDLRVVLRSRPSTPAWANQLVGEELEVVHTFSELEM